MACAASSALSSKPHCDKGWRSNIRETLGETQFGMFALPVLLELCPRESDHEGLQASLALVALLGPALVNPIAATATSSL